MATRGTPDFTFDKIIHIKCCLCTHENRTREAEKYCVECKDYFCSSCVEIHNKLSSIKGHQILGKGDFKSLGPDGSLPSYPTQRCSQHPLEVVTMYCKDHDDVTCGPCVALYHRSCSNITFIPDNIEDLYQRSNLNDLKQELSDTKETMEEIKQTNEAKIQRKKEALNKEIEFVQAFRQKLETLLDKAEQDTIQELKTEFSKIEAALTDGINKAESLINLLNEAASQLRKSEGNLAQEFVCAKSAQKLIVSGQEVETTHLAERDETVSFTPDRSIKEALKQSMGKVSIKSCFPKDGLYKVKHRKEIDVKLNNDKKNCHNVASCITDDGYLLVVDNNNLKLKRVDISTEKVKDYIDFSRKFSPKGVCIVSRKEAAVSLENLHPWDMQFVQFVSPEEKWKAFGTLTLVQFVSLVEKMKATRSLKMKHRCQGLAHKDEKLFISDWEKTVYIYDLNGQLKLTVTQDGSGKAIFHCNQLITVSASVDWVFVADWDNGIVVLDSQRKYLSTHTAKNVKGYREVCTDGKNIFLIGNFSDNIVQFDHSFKILGEVIKVKRPLSICFDTLKMRLLVLAGNSDKIMVFELE